MDLVLSLTIEKSGVKANDKVVQSYQEHWLENANTTLMAIFNHSEVDEKIEDIKKTNEINVDNLDICYEAGQYYVMHEDTPHPLNDQDKINLPGYIVTVHIRNNSQVNGLSMGARYSENLIDFDYLDSVDPYFPGEIDVKQNVLEHHIDLPHMVLEDRQDRQQIERERDEFYPPLAPKSKNREEHNILNILGISDQSNGFVDEVYEDTQSHYYDHREENKLEQQVDTNKNLQSRGGYFKKAIFGT